MKVETKQLDCGLYSYSYLDVPHNWNPKPLNPCKCGGEFNGWSIAVGHYCLRCKATCNGACLG